MLEKEVRKSIENINETKKSMIQMNIDVLKMNTELSEHQLKSIDNNIEQNEDLKLLESKYKELEELKVELNKDMEEETRNELLEKENNISEEISKLKINISEDDIKLLDQKNNIIQELSKLKEDMDKENEEIEEIGKDIELKGSRYEDTYELLEELDKRSTVDEHESNPEQVEKILRVKSLIMPTLDLSRLENTKIRLTKNYLKSNYNKLAKDLQNKLAKDKKFIYPSCFQLKASIRDIIKTESPELEDKELDKLAKLYTSYLIIHLNSIDLKTEGIYVYYLMQNIYKIESMQIDKQFEFKQKLLSILQSRI